MWYKKNFLNQKDMVIKFFKKNGVTAKTMADFTAVGIPITVMCEFIKEEMPEHTEICDKKIKEINEFYGIKDE